MAEISLVKKYEKILKGKYIKIYEDDLTKKVMEGLARVRSVYKVEELSRTLDAVFVECHFKGDEKYMLVQRVVSMRSLVRNSEGKLSVDKITE